MGGQRRLVTTELMRFSEILTSLTRHVRYTVCINVQPFLLKNALFEIREGLETLKERSIVSSDVEESLNESPQGCQTLRSWGTANAPEREYQFLAKE